MDTRTPLGQLIEKARELAELSQQQLADRATARGIPMSKQNVSRLVNDNPLKSINGNSIKGVAIALGLAERRVAAAALASMGVDLALEETPLRQAIMDATEIDERTKKALLALLNIEQKEGSEHGDSSAEKSASVTPIGAQRKVSPPAKKAARGTAKKPGRPRGQSNKP